MKLPLSQRLLACCKYIEQNSCVADVGCDHGYLGIHLLLTGIAKRVISADVNEQPLQSAMTNAKKFGVQNQMDFYLSNGAQKIPRDFDTLVCAGMGGDTMISILSAAQWLKSEQYRLVLQCQSKTPMLRSYLYEHGWKISRETLAKDGKFVYSIMDVRYEPGEHTAPWQCYISTALLADQHPLLPEYYQRIYHGLQLQVDGLRRTCDPKLDQQQLLLSDMKALEEIIYGNSR